MTKMAERQADEKTPQVKTTIIFKEIVKINMRTLPIITNKDVWSTQTVHIVGTD